jgi:hypothetical protein
MKKLVFLFVCILTLHATSLGSGRKANRSRTALSADEKKKLEDSLQMVGSLAESWRCDIQARPRFENWAPGGTNSIALLIQI